MKQETIDIIRERIAHAHKAHGPFITYGHVLGTLRLELDETQYAANWQGRQRLIDELLDVATVAIRAAEQLS